MGELKVIRGMSLKGIPDAWMLALKKFGEAIKASS
jgi:hypothetical protein